MNSRTITHGLFCILLLAEPTATSPAFPATQPTICSYRPFKWHAATAKAVPQDWVRHDYESLTPHEVDTLTGCTVCQEDQVTIDIPPLDSFRICNRLADQVRVTLSELIDAGEAVYEVAGYRAGLTRGALDSLGFRTEFSSHAFGIAVDINPQQNGFYHSCVEFGPECRLVQGGVWKPGQPGALTADGNIVRALESAGFRWGGEIAGSQKDFMHFSPTGY